jgi:hypothetical protein
MSAPQTVLALVENIERNLNGCLDVIREDAIKVGISARTPDYSFRIGTAPESLYQDIRSPRRYSCDRGNILRGRTGECHVAVLARTVCRRSPFGFAMPSAVRFFSGIQFAEAVNWIAA